MKLRKSTKINIKKTDNNPEIIDTLSISKKIDQSRNKTNTSINETSEFFTSKKIIDLIKNNKLEKIIELINSRQIDIDTKLWNGNTMIMMAAHFENNDLINSLIDLGANLNIENKYGQTILLLLILSNNKNFNLYKKLLNLNATPGAIKDITYHTQYKLNDTKIINLFKKFNFIQTKRNEKVNKNTKAYINAVYALDTKSMINLIDKGVDINTGVLKTTGTAISFAARFNNLEMVLTLLKKGANVNYTDNHMQSTLHHALQSKNIDLIKAIINHGGSVITKDDLYGSLFSAAVQINSEITKLFIENYANPNTIGKFYGNSVLHDTMNIIDSDDALKSVKLLVAYGCDINIEDKYGNTPIKIAMLKGHTNIVEYLKPLVKKIPENFNETDKTSNDFRFPSYWLKPNGKTFKCETGTHAEVAESNFNSTEVELEKIGWIKISRGQIQTDLKNLNSNISLKQINFIYSFLKERGRINELKNKKFDIIDINEKINAGELIYQLGNIPNKTSPFLIGNKANQLDKMLKLNFPIPNGFVISTKSSQNKNILHPANSWDEALDYYHSATEKLPTKEQKKLWELIKKQIKILENKTGKKFGDKDNPLIVSVRSGAAISMPGIMSTKTNIGLTKDNIEGLSKKFQNPKEAYIMLIKNIIKNSGNKKLNTYGSIKFFLKNHNKKSLYELELKELKKLINFIKTKAIGNSMWEDFTLPSNAYAQLRKAILKVNESFYSKTAKAFRKINGIPNEIKTAITIQEMKFGNAGKLIGKGIYNCGTGVLFTRNPNNGTNEISGEFLFKSQGENLVSGKQTPKSIYELQKHLPTIYNELIKYAKQLEIENKDMQDIEFTIENSELFILQTRNGKRSKLAEIIIANSLKKEGIISSKKIKKIITPEKLETANIKTVNNKIKHTEKGLSASPGIASGIAIFNKEKAIKLAESGEKVILITKYANVEDVEATILTEGSITINGGKYCHSALIARDIKKPCIVGCKNATNIKNGDLITIDGSTGLIYNGEITDIESPYEEILNTIKKELT